MHGGCGVSWSWTRGIVRWPVIVIRKKYKEIRMYEINYVRTNLISYVRIYKIRIFVRTNLNSTYEINFYEFLYIFFLMTVTGHRITGGNMKKK